jgi:hypothetical protein
MSNYIVRDSYITDKCTHVIDSKNRAIECGDPSKYHTRHIGIGVIIGFIIGLIIFIALHSMQPNPVSQKPIQKKEGIRISRGRSNYGRSNYGRSTYGRSNYGRGMYDYDRNGHYRRNGGYDRNGNLKQKGKPVNTTHLLAILFCMVAGGIAGYFLIPPPDTMSMYEQDKVILDEMDAEGKELDGISPTEESRLLNVKRLIRSRETASELKELRDEQNKYRRDSGWQVTI